MKKNIVRTTAVISVIFIQAAVAGCGKTPEEERLEKIRRGEERLNVVLISIDTLRADALGCYGGNIVPTPNIDSLAAAGTLFAECKSPTPLTLPSHTTMLTGTLPPYHGVHNNDVAVPADLVFLSEVLRDNGYRTAGIIGGFPLDDVFGFDQGFDYYDDDFVRGRGTSLVGFETPADVLAVRCRKWLTDRGEKPFFLFVHFFDPHTPYTPPERYYSSYRSAPYYGEVASVDEAIGKIIESLKRLGLADTTLVILTADHGEALGDHGEINHGFFVYEATQHVPLIFYCPALVQRGRVVRGPVSLADIFPTVLDMIGIDIPASVQGESLVPFLYRKAKTDRPIYEETFFGSELFGWAPLYAIEDNGWKYIDAPKPELYNLYEDPSESANLADEEPVRANRMADELDELLRDLAADGPAGVTPAPLGDGDKNKLEALGYVSGGGSEKPGAGADPKDHVETIRLYGEYRDALSLLENERLINILSSMVELEPDAAFPLVTLGLIYKNVDDYKNAETYLEKALRLHPGYVDGKIHLAKTHIATGDYEAAEVLLREVQNDPDSTPIDLAKTYVSLGNLAAATGKSVEETARYYESAVKLHQDFARPYYELAILYGSSPGRTEIAKGYAAAFLNLEPRGEDAARMREILGQEPVEELASRGKRAYFNKDYESAAEYYARAYEQDPRNYELRYNLACCLARAGQPDEALAELKGLTEDAPGVFDEAIAQDPDLDSLRTRDDFKAILD